MMHLVLKIHPDGYIPLVIEQRVFRPCHEAGSSDPHLLTSLALGHTQEHDHDEARYEFNRRHDGLWPAMLVLIGDGQRSVVEHVRDEHEDEV